MGSNPVRFTDFVVNEITPTGEVVHLDNLKAPKYPATVNDWGTIPDNEKSQPEPQPESHPVKPAVRSSAANDEGADHDNRESQPMSPENFAILVFHFGENVAKEVIALHDRIIQNPNRKPKDHGSVTSSQLDRQTRTKVHQDVRGIFESRLDSVAESGTIVVKAASSDSSYLGQRNKRQNNSNRSTRGNSNRGSPNRVNKGKQFAELGGEYLHFTLCKANKDTMEAVGFLARELKMQPKAFQFAGTKDRRAVTTQRISVHRVLAERMLSIGRSLRNAKIGNYEYRKDQLRLGELSGNEFHITLRDCQFHCPFPEDSNEMIQIARGVIVRTLNCLVQEGFVNYYGLQRFGTFSTGTDQIGLKMLKGDFEGAVNDILHVDHSLLAIDQDSLSEDRVSRDNVARARAINGYITTREPGPALKTLPKKFSAESAIIRCLGNSKKSRDFLGALQAIPRALRLMYVHAYQSIVWNMAASHRYKLAGSKVIEGDLVLVSEHRDEAAMLPEAEAVDEDGETVILPAIDDQATDSEDMFTRARPLSKEEAESGVYKIFDVVLPLPGYDIIYPNNEMSSYYVDFMGSERGGGLDPYDMRRAQKDISLSGGYRKILARPGKDCSYAVVAYHDNDQQFVETDLDRVNARGLDHGNDEEDGWVKVEKEPTTAYKIAVILKLQLGSSQYATIALRELMKLGGLQAYQPDFGTGR